LSNFKEELELANTLGKLSKKQIKKYLVILFFGIVLACVPFLLFTVVGVGNNSNWTILLGGLWKAIFGFVVAIIFSLIAIPALYLFKGKQGIDVYLRTILGATLVGLCTSLLLMIIPVQSNPENIPIFIICLVVLGIIATLNFNIRLIGIFVGIVFFLTLLSFFLPNKFQEARSAISDFDESRSYVRPQLKKYSSKPEGEKVPLSATQSQQSYRDYSQPKENTNTSKSSNQSLVIAARPSYEIAVMIAGHPSDSETIASALRSRGKKAISASKIPGNPSSHAKYMISGEKSIQFGIDKTFGRSDVIEAQVTLDITMTETRTGSIIRKFQVFKKISGLSKESAGEKATTMALSEVNEKIS